MSEGEEKGLKTFSLEAVAEHNIAKGEDKSIWTVVHDRVYDITKFLDEHPGGEEILIENAGIDSTEAFEDVGHSSDAREMLKEYLIGDLNEGDCKQKPKRKFTLFSDEQLDKTKAGSIVCEVTGEVIATYEANFTEDQFTDAERKFRGLPALTEKERKALSLPELTDKERKALYDEMMADKKGTVDSGPKSWASTSGGNADEGGWSQYILPVGIALLAAIGYRTIFGGN